MLTDFFTKTLQGSLFRTFRDVIMDYEHISNLDEVEGDLIPEERVRINEELAKKEEANIINGDAAKLLKLQAWIEQLGTVGYVWSLLKHKELLDMLRTFRNLTNL